MTILPNMHKEIYFYIKTLWCCSFLYKSSSDRSIPYVGYKLWKELQSKIEQNYTQSRQIFIKNIGQFPFNNQFNKFESVITVVVQNFILR